MYLIRQTFYEKGREGRQAEWAEVYTPDEDGVCISTRPA
jgi:hypothetical protein